MGLKQQHRIGGREYYFRTTRFIYMYTFVNVCNNHCAALKDGSIRGICNTSNHRTWENNAHTPKMSSMTTVSTTSR